MGRPATLISQTASSGGTRASASLSSTSRSAAGGQLAASRIAEDPGGRLPAANTQRCPAFSLRPGPPRPSCLAAAGLATESSGPYRRLAGEVVASCSAAATTSARGRRRSSATR
jgi:hypothetical protein